MESYGELPNHHSVCHINLLVILYYLKVEKPITKSGMICCHINLLVIFYYLKVEKPIKLNNEMNEMIGCCGRINFHSYKINIYNSPLNQHNHIIIICS
jgi:hypothetical protein